MPDMDLISTLGELAAHADLCAADPAASTIDQLVARHRAAEYRRLQLRHLARIAYAVRSEPPTAQCAFPSTAAITKPPKFGSQARK